MTVIDSDAFIGWETNESVEKRCPIGRRTIGRSSPVAEVIKYVLVFVKV